MSSEQSEIPSPPAPLIVTDTEIYRFFQQYYFHQDQLSWGRTQTLLAIQAGTLAASFAASNRFLAAIILLLGLWLTVMAFRVIRRDWQIQDWVLSTYLRPTHLAHSIESSVEPHSGCHGGRGTLEHVVYVVASIDVLLTILNIVSGLGISLAGLDRLLPT